MESLLNGNLFNPADCIKETFAIVRRKEEGKNHGNRGTKHVILEIYDEMAEAIRTGKPYQTLLDPPRPSCNPAAEMESR